MNEFEDTDEDRERYNLLQQIFQTMPVVCVVGHPQTDDPHMFHMFVFNEVSEPKKLFACILQGDLEIEMTKWVRESFLDSISNVVVFPFEEIRQCVSRGRSQMALDIVFAEFDRRLNCGQFDECDKILSLVELDLIDPTVAIGYLTITKPAADRLPSRKGFFERVKSWMVYRLGEERTRALLKTRE